MYTLRWFPRLILFVRFPETPSNINYGTLNNCANDKRRNHSPVEESPYFHSSVKDLLRLRRCLSKSLSNNKTQNRHRGKRN